MNEASRVVTPIAQTQLTPVEEAAARVLTSIAETAAGEAALAPACADEGIASSHAAPSFDVLTCRPAPPG